MQKREYKSLYERTNFALFLPRTFGAPSPCFWGRGWGIPVSYTHLMLTPRQGFVLQAICDLYSETGEPVSSGAIAKLAGDAFSSATIRSEMARLEALGCVKQPHTSAGRIPTAQGYRYYINHLMPRRELPVEKQREIARFLRQGVRDPDILLTRASSLLAYMTNYACLLYTSSTTSNSAPVAIILMRWPGRTSPSLTRM